MNVPIESDGISSHRQTSDMDVLQRYAWEFLEGGSYGANSYSKGELMLRTLKRYLGPDLFADMIKSYSQRWWFRHPKPKDFYDAVAEFAGQDMSLFLDQFVFVSGKLDYAIGNISSKEPKQKKGWFGGDYMEDSSEKRDEKIYESEVLVRRLGEVKIPVEILVIFEDGATIEENWDGQYRWKKFEYSGPSRLRKAIVDPAFKLVIDVDRTNNSMARKANKVAPLKWVSRWLLWLQHTLEFFTVFGG